MTKLPFMQFFPDLWLRDTRKLSAAAKAVWIDVIAYCWNEPKRGVYHRTKEAMARELGIAEKDLSPILSELSLSGVADILNKEDGSVLIMSRRILKIESKREYERKKKQRQRCPDDVPIVSPDVPEARPQNVPGETLDVRRQTSEVTTPPVVPLPGDAPPSERRNKKRRQHQDPRLAIDHWQDLVNHINTAWKNKKGVGYPWDSHEFKKLRDMAGVYQASGVMAMFDLYVQLQTYFGKLTGYMLDGLKKDIGVIVDDPRWKLLSKKYDDQLYAAATPSDDTVSTKEVIANLTKNAKTIMGAT